MAYTTKDPSRLSASHLTASTRTHSFTSMSSDARSFHTASSPIDMEEERTMRTPSPPLRASSPSIPRRTSSRLSTSKTPINRARTSSPMPRTISPIPPHLRSASTANTGIVTRSPSKRSHTPFPYAVSQKMERSDSGYEDGRERMISPKGRKSPLSATEKGAGKIKARGGSESTSRASSRPASSCRSSTRSSPQTSVSSPNTSTSTSTRNSSISITTRHSTSTKRPKMTNSSQITRSVSYQAPSSHKPRMSTRNESYPTEQSVQECRLSNLRQRHCFYQFPPLPSSPPSTGHASRKGSGAGLSLSEYAIPPPNHPYHQSIYSPDQPADSPFDASRSTSYRSAATHIEAEVDVAPEVPPATTLYFLTPETRRLEYAAIDAASRGIRGLVSKLVPDCMLPKPERGGFHDNGKGEDDGGSVRRYRLVDVGGDVGRRSEGGGGRPSEDSGDWSAKERTGRNKRASWNGWKKWVGVMKGRVMRG